MDDGTCEKSPTGLHEWRLTDVIVGTRGADNASDCTRCGALQYEPGQAALRDRRPPLGAGET